MSDDVKVYLPGAGGDDKFSESDIITALKEIYDPEIPVNIYDLGLIYKINITGRDVDIDMTLTSPTCPMADEIPVWVAAKISKIPGINNINVKIVWQPAWGIDMMSDEARFQLDLTEQGW
jgi:FeS assembly SUF system protein